MAFTKVVGPGIHTLSNILSHNINSSGIITATQFDGPFSDVVVGGATTLTVDGINISAGILTAKTLDLNGNGDISGNLVLGGDLTVNGTTTTLDTNLIGVDRIEVLTDGTNVAVAVTHNGTGDLVRLYDGTSQKVTVDDEGQVAIGTVTPLSALDVRGTTHALGNGGAALVWGNTTSLGTLTYSGSNARITASNDLQIHSTKLRVGGGTTESADGAFDDLIIGTHSGNRGISILSGASSQGALGFAKPGTLADGYVAYNHNSTATDSSMVIKSSGKIQFNAGSSQKVTITDGGLLYVGRNSGTFRIDAQHAGEDIIRINNSNESSHGDVDAKLVAGGSYYQNLKLVGSSFKFNTYSGSETTKVTIDSTGAIVKQQFTATNTYIGTATTQCGYQAQNLSNTTNTYAALRLTAGASSPATAQLSSIRTGAGANDFTIQLETGNTAFEALRIDSSGRLMVGNTAASSFNTSINQFVLGNGVGNNGMVVYTGASHAGSLIFNDVADGTFQGGLVYKHGSGTDDNQLRIFANASSRVQAGATYLQVDDGTNARLRIAPDGTSTNMLVSTTTGNGSYCNLSYQAANHIFKYGGNERGRLSTEGDFTITGEVAAAQDYPVVKPTLDINFVNSTKIDPRLIYFRSGAGSYTDSEGFVRLVGENEPRFDHDPETREPKGLLMELGKTSKLTQSTGYRSYAVYHQTKVGFNTKGPDGIENSAYEYIHDGTSGTASGGSTSIWADANLDGHTGLCCSYYVKITRGTSMGFMILDNNNGKNSQKVAISGGVITDDSFATVSLVSGVGEEGTTEFDRLRNGWVRIKWYGASLSSSATSYLQLYVYDTVPTSNGSNIGYAIWGFQVENGLTVTSFIDKPTNSVVSRGEDRLSLEGEELNKIYNHAESSIYAEYTHNHIQSSIGTARRVYKFAAKTGADTRIDYVTNTGFNPYIAEDGSSPASPSHGQNFLYSGGVNKTAVKVKKDDFATTLNGSSIVADTSGQWPPANTINFLSIGWSYASSNTSIGGHFRRFTYYPVGLPNSQLVTLTS